MDYAELAETLIKKMHAFHKARSQKSIFGALQGEAFVLKYISLRDEGVLPGEISNEMDVSSARVAAALNKLEDKGFITRKIDKNDRRKILVEITQEGRRLAEKHQKVIVEEVADMLRYLGEDDAREYIRILGRLAER